MVERKIIKIIILNERFKNLLAIGEEEGALMCETKSTTQTEGKKVWFRVVQVRDQTNLLYLRNQLLGGCNELSSNE